MTKITITYINLVFNKSNELYHKAINTNSIIERQDYLRRAKRLDIFADRLLYNIRRR